MSSDDLQRASEEQEVEKSKYDSPREIYIDHGPPPPDRYGVDKIRLLVQCPTTITAQWELSGETSGGILGGADAERTLLRLHNATKDQSHIQEADPTADNWWFSAEPDTEYHIEIGMRCNGRDHWIARSNTVRTPRDSVSDTIDGEWMLINERFHSLLKFGGFDEERYLERQLGASMGAVFSGVLTEAIFSGALLSGQNIYGSLSSMSFGTRGKI